LYKTRLLNIISFDELGFLEFQGDKDTRQRKREEKDHRGRFRGSFRGRDIHAEDEEDTGNLSRKYEHALRGRFGRGIAYLGAVLEAYRPSRHDKKAENKTRRQEKPVIADEGKSHQTRDDADHC